MVELKNITKIYRQGPLEIPALKEINLQIPQGEFCLLMGPSGCGKSTLLNLVGGLDNPTSGELFFNGNSTAAFTDREWTICRRTEIGIVFQFFNLLPTLPVYENVSLPLVLNKISRKETDARVLELIGRMGLKDKVRSLPGTLSGGEQQRVAIARALVHSPRILLADEPTGNLDTRMGREILALIQSLSKENKMTVIMATHSQETAAFGDRIIPLKDGRISS
ncbi:MAG: ABC transporter ATP-binding protein [Nitrospirae bacterium]|nr:ABC transporter ATP-binding protein [Nitrospirota bacterium]